MKKNIILLFGISVLICLLFFLGILLGAEKIPLNEVFLDTSNSLYNLIIFDIRLPRCILAFICGILLGGSGCIFQGYFRNSLADPSLLGISSGATLGVVLSLNFFNSMFLPLAGFIGAMVSLGVIFTISGKKSLGYEPIKLLLAGNIVNIFLSSITSLYILLHDKELYKMYTWTLGSLNGKSWTEVKILIIPSIIAMFSFIIISPHLDILATGDKTAISLGLSTKKLRIVSLLVGCFANALAVATLGTVGFIGLIAPHSSRLFLGASFKKIMPLSMLFGGILLLFADILCRCLIPPMEIPLGIITALCGCPFFIALLAKKGKIYG